MRKSALFVLPLLASVALCQPKPDSDIFFTKTKAYVLGTPVSVAAGTVSQMQWSSDGKFLMVASVDLKVGNNIEALFNNRQMPQVIPDGMLSIYSVAKQSFTTVWKSPMDRKQVRGFQWIPNSPFAVAIVFEPIFDPQTKTFASGRFSSVLINSAGRISTLYQAGEDETLSLQGDVGAFGAIIRSAGTPDSRFTLTLVGRDGRIAGRIPGNSLGYIYWDKAARQIYSVETTLKDNKPVQQWYALDFANGRRTPVAARRFEAPDPESAEFDLQLGSTLSRQSDSSAELKGAWLVAAEKGPRNSAMVAADAEVAELSPTLDSVSYTTKGMAMVRPLISIPKELALKAMEAAERTKILSDAKQVALGLIMYSSDHDDTLPGNGGDWASLISPYLRNNTLMDGFVYTFAGGNLADVKDPAKTEIGYKSGPGGRAVAYADGHVRWIPDN
ncbi:MAG TPA: hypothetical protein VJ835_04280 [Fimbriimonadaceae bacterium]|nr:hypothetical protein [Fimbriimonadaceae bacterium]